MLRILVILLFATNLVHAEEYKTLLDLPTGVTLLNVSATVRKDVTQDLLVTHLRYENRNRDVRVVQDEINQKIQAAIEIVKQYKDLKVSTTQYNIYQTQVPPNRADLIWVGSQGLEMKSQKSDVLLKVAGELQGMGFAMSSMSYEVSPDLYDATHDSLMEEALQKLRERAARAARVLGKREADLAEVDVANDSLPFMGAKMTARSFAMEAASDVAMTSPTADAGETTISLTVSARALLKP